MSWCVCFQFTKRSFPVGLHTAGAGLVQGHNDSPYIIWLKCLPPPLLLHSSSNSGHVLKGWLRSRGTTPVVKISFLILHLCEQLANMLCCFSLLKTGESIQTCRTQNIIVFFQRSEVVKEAETITRIPAGVSIWIYEPVSLKGTQLFFPSLETNVV